MSTSSNLPGFAFTLLWLVDPNRRAVKTLTRQPDGTIELERIRQRLRVGVQAV